MLHKLLINYIKLVHMLHNQVSTVTLTDFRTDMDFDTKL